MRGKLLVFLALILLCVAGRAYAEPEDLVRFDLSLAGYVVGMSYQQASMVRALHSTEDPVIDEDGALAFKASVDSVYVDGLEMSLLLKFKNDKLSMLIARVPHADFGQVVKRFQTELGEGDDKSRVFQNYEGREIRQTSYLWDFPNEKIWLSATPSLTEYATLSLSAKKSEGAPVEAGH